MVAEVVTVGANFIWLVEPGRSQGQGLRLYLHDEDWVTEAGSTVRVEAFHLAEEARHFVA